jgi:ATP-dependent DNA ligase
MLYAFNIALIVSDVVFDILYLNGKCLLDIPLKDRRKYLCGLIDPKPNILQVIDHVEGTTQEDIVSTLEGILRNRGEGVIVKDPYAKYVPGARDNRCLKIKVTPTFDV